MAAWSQKDSVFINTKYFPAQYSDKEQHGSQRYFFRTSQLCVLETGQYEHFLEISNFIPMYLPPGWQPILSAI